MPKKQFAEFQRKDINDQGMYRNRNRRTNEKLGTMYDLIINEGLDNGNQYQFEDVNGVNVHLVDGDVVLRADKHIVRVWRPADRRIHRFRKPKKWCTGQPYDANDLSKGYRWYTNISKPVVRGDAKTTWRIGQEVRLGAVVAAKMHALTGVMVNEGFIEQAEPPKENPSPLEKLLQQYGEGFWILRIFPKGEETRVRVFGTQIFPVQK